jgi:hypothetical protein
LPLVGVLDRLEMARRVALEAEVADRLGGILQQPRPEPRVAPGPRDHLRAAPGPDMFGIGLDPGVDRLGRDKPALDQQAFQRLHP